MSYRQYLLDYMREYHIYNDKDLIKSFAEILDNKLTQSNGEKLNFNAYTPDYTLYDAICGAVPINDKLYSDLNCTKKMNYVNIKREMLRILIKTGFTDRESEIFDSVDNFRLVSEIPLLYDDIWYKAKEYSLKDKTIVKLEDGAYMITYLGIKRYYEYIYDWYTPCFNITYQPEAKDCMYRSRHDTLIEHTSIISSYTNMLLFSELVKSQQTINEDNIKFQKSISKKNDFMQKCMIIATFSTALATLAMFFK